MFDAVCKPYLFGKCEFVDCKKLFTKTLRARSAVCWFSAMPIKELSAIPRLAGGQQAGCWEPG